MLSRRVGSSSSLVELRSFWIIILSYSPLLKQLIDAFCCLPGVGPRTAQRMALHLLERKRDAGRELAHVLSDAMDAIGRCSRCRTLTEQPTCDICCSKRRDEGLLCVVENPGDIIAIEQSAEYQGYYFVLLGHLSPLDGIGPADIGVDELMQRVHNDKVSEVILATGTTVEGEATAYYISEQLEKTGISVTRIAHGVPLGGELEYVDGGTIARALSGRSQL